MSVVQEVKLPEYLMKHVRELAEREGVSVDQFIASAVAEKASAWTTLDYLKIRAERGSREKFLAALAMVPDVEPDPKDRLD
jgi:hypothetical protein